VVPGPLFFFFRTYLYIGELAAVLITSFRNFFISSSSLPGTHFIITPILSKFGARHG
jgi:hypothetical protein